MAATQVEPHVIAFQGERIPQTIYYLPSSLETFLIQRKACAAPVTPFSYPAIRIFYIWMDMKRDVLLRGNVVIDLLFFLLYFRFSHSYISQVNKHLKRNYPSHCHHWGWLVSHNETKVKFTSNRQCWWSIGQNLVRNFMKKRKIICNTHIHGGNQ